MRVLASPFLFSPQLLRSICMDLLTQSGWSPVNSIESILIQIRTEMVEGGGRLDLANQRAYTVEEVSGD